MALYKIALFFGVVLAVGISQSSGCATELQECMAKVQEVATKAGDVAAMCKAVTGAKNCLMSIQDKCTGALADAVKQSLNALKQSEDACGGSTGGDGSDGGSSSGSNEDCSVSAYKDCATKATKDDICPAYKCVESKKSNCDGKGFDEFYKEAKEIYDNAKAKCGCGNLQPFLGLLVTALIMAVKSYF